MKQLWASELFGALYITFNIIFYFTAPEEDRLLYSILDWEEEPVGAIIYTVIILGVLIPIFAVIHLGVFRWAGRGVCRLPEGGTRVFFRGTGLQSHGYCHGVARFDKRP